MVAIDSQPPVVERADDDTAAPREPERGDARRRLPSWMTRLAGVLVVLAALACIAITRPGAWVLIGTLLLGLSVMPWHGARRQELLTGLLGVTVLVTAVDYLTWRVEVTNWVYWGLIAGPLLIAEIFGALHTLGLQYTIWPKPQPEIVYEDDPTLRPIFIFIPTVNEGPSVLRPTIQAALEARRAYLNAFPHGQVTVAICNDGLVAGAAVWREVDDLARRMGVVCVTRTLGGGAKAGNLEYARQLLHATGDALVVIFDADQIAHSDFLLKAIPWFADPNIGWVQTGQYYRNLDQPVAHWANDQQGLFYRVLCPGKAAHNAAFICGTNVVIRAEALDRIGGLPQDSVTEDFAASIQLHPEWRSIFLSDVLATGLGPMDLPAYLKQQRRWAIGTISVLRAHWQAIFLPHRKGLNLEQRIQYGLACTHYLSGLRDLVFVISPLVFLITGIPAVRSATLSLFLWHFLPYWIATQAAFWFAGHGKTGIRGIVIGFGSFPSLIHALGIVLLGRRSGFMVTSKQRSGRRAWSHLVIYAVTLAACFGGIWLGLTNKTIRPESLVISILWIAYDVALLGAVLWLGVIDLRFNEALAGRRREIIARPALWRLWDRRMGAGWVVATMTAFIAISGPLLVTSSQPNKRPVVFAVNIGNGIAPHLGLTLPTDLLKTRPAALEQRVCLPFTIIGRTQTVQDSFDYAWAEQLAANGDIPWITLQFGTFDASGDPPLSASLPAIANGVQDSNIRRWAQEIHTYGHPVYLTILLHVDRNWSVSSAVANGGIPQDVPRAWEHVQSIFAAAGDTNVSWVWAPADPAHDQPYAPPEGTIDVVLQSMIRYPSTPWPDAQAVLSAVSARHPAKPLFIEISANGEAAQKAAWINQVAAAVRADPQVYALFYHEGSPDIHATVADNNQWSVESDARTLQAVSAWQSLVPSATLPCGASLPAKAHTPQTPTGGRPDQPTGALLGESPFRVRLAGR